MRIRTVWMTVALVACAGGRKDEKDAPAAEQPAVPSAPARPAPPEDPQPARERVVIIGVSGVDPDWVDRWRRDLPNLDGLISGQSVSGIDTTVPAQAAVAWTSFATGTSPGKHGVYGLISRDPATYRPVPGAIDYLDATFDASGVLIGAPAAFNQRKGRTFWQMASSSGHRVKLLFVPYAYPLDEGERVEALAGEGLPDLRLTNSTFTLFGTDLTEAQATADVPGGDLVRLEGAGPYTADLVGPASASGAWSKVPVSVSVVGADKVSVEVGGGRVEGRVGAFTDWVSLSFPLSSTVTAKGRVRFFPVQVGERTRIYASPVVADPRDPSLQVAAPAAFGKEVFDTYGDWKALGWSADTAALSSDLVPESLFALDLKDTLSRRVNIVLGELGRRDAELVVAVLSGADLASHMFMRLNDPSHPAYNAELAATYGSLVKDVYVQLDDAIGEIKKGLKQGDTLIIVSESGFQSFRREFQVNTWLLENGYLKLAPGVVRSDDNAVSLEQVDWKKTSAYAVGGGYIYLNVKGREAQGTVPPARARALAAEIATKLPQVRDGRDQVISRVLIGEDLYRGEAASSAPDLVLTFLDGYQPGRATALGKIPMELFSDNKRRWSGDHAASDPSDVPGFLVTTLSAPPKAPRIVDVGPTALALLGVLPPVDCDGRSWVEVRKRTGGGAP